MNVVQTKLSRKTETGTANMILWLPAQSNVRVGTILSLQGSDVRWKVEAQWMTQDHSLINTKWGTDLPKSQRTER